MDTIKTLSSLYVVLIVAGIMGGYGLVGSIGGYGVLGKEYNDIERCAVYGRDGLYLINMLSSVGTNMWKDKNDR